MSILRPCHFGFIVRPLDGMNDELEGRNITADQASGRNHVPTISRQFQRGVRTEKERKTERARRETRHGETAGLAAAGRLSGCRAAQIRFLSRPARTIKVSALTKNIHTSTY